MPRRPIVLTFDDGYLGDYTVARPVLQRFGWPAELNLIETRMWHRDSAGLTPTMIRQLIKDGWVIDSHTITHRDLTTLGPTQLWQEVHRSRVLLQRMFGVPIDGFCYPAGRYDTQVIADVRRAGYRDATTEIVGTATPATNRYQLPRIRVSYRESPHTLIQSLTR